MRFKPIRIGSRAPLHKRIRSRFVSWLLGLKQLQLVQTVPYDPKNVQVGLGWPEVAHTMIGMKRLDNVQKCCELKIMFPVTLSKRASGAEERQFSCARP